MTNPIHVKINTGVYAGTGVYVAFHANCRATHLSEVDANTYGQGIYIPELNLRLATEYKEGSTQWGETIHYDDVVTAFDKYGTELFAGDQIYASVAGQAALLTIVKMTTVNHVGYGWLQRKMRCTDNDTGKTLTVNVPAYVMKK